MADWEEATGQRETDIRMGFVHTAERGGTHQGVRWDHSLHVGEQHAFTKEEQRTIIAAREAEERVLQQEDGSPEDEDSDDDVFEGEGSERPPDGTRDRKPGGVGHPTVCTVIPEHWQMPDMSSDGDGDEPDEVGHRTVCTVIPEHWQMPDMSSSEGEDEPDEEKEATESGQQTNQHPEGDYTSSWVTKHFRRDGNRCDGGDEEVDPARHSPARVTAGPNGCTAAETDIVGGTLNAGTEQNYGTSPAVGGRSGTAQLPAHAQVDTSHLDNLGANSRHSSGETDEYRYNGEPLTLWRMFPRRYPGDPDWVQPDGSFRDPEGQYEGYDEVLAHRESMLWGDREENRVITVQVDEHGNPMRSVGQRHPEGEIQLPRLTCTDDEESEEGSIHGGEPEKESPGGEFNCWKRRWRQ